MCGRFTIISEPLIYQMEFNIDIPDSIKQDWKPHYNIAPTQIIPTIRNEKERIVDPMQWGLVPTWSKDQIRLINVRAETILEKATFRKLMQQGQRCLIFANGFYEWQDSDQKDKPKRPYYFQLKNGKPFMFAGIWDFNKNSSEQKTCAIITCPPNSLVGKIHNRMPVIFDSSSCWQWLSQESIQALSLLKSYPENDMTFSSVGSLVNNPTLDVPECIVPSA